MRIYEYCERPFHGKVALVDDEWSTVGSSNLDPLSLSLNLEANVFIRDRRLCAELKTRLGELMRSQCKQVDAAALPRDRLWRPVTRPLLFHVLRHFPDWLGWLPAHTPKTRLIAPDPARAKDGP